MIFVGAGLVPAHNRGKHKALPLQNVNDFLIGINSIILPQSRKCAIHGYLLEKDRLFV